MWGQGCPNRTEWRGLGGQDGDEWLIAGGYCGDTGTSILGSEVLGFRVQQKRTESRGQRQRDKVNEMSKLKEQHQGLEVHCTAEATLRGVLSLSISVKTELATGGQNWAEGRTEVKGLFWVVGPKVE